MKFISGISVALPEFTKRVRRHPVINRASEQVQSYFQRVAHVPYLPTSEEIARLNKDMAEIDEAELRLLLLDDNYRLLKLINFRPCKHFGVMASLHFLPTVLAVRNSAVRFALVLNDPYGSLFSDNEAADTAQDIKIHARLYGIDCIDAVVIDDLLADGNVAWRSLLDSSEEVLMNHALNRIPYGDYCA